jgi:hypothetical protein
LTEPKYTKINPIECSQRDCFDNWRR